MQNARCSFLHRAFTLRVFYRGDNNYRNSIVSFCNTALLLIIEFFLYLLQSRKKHGII